jgi:hypothetical protein
MTTKTEPDLDRTPRDLFDGGYITGDEMEHFERDAKEATEAWARDPQAVYAELLSISRRLKKTNRLLADLVTLHVQQLNAAAAQLVEPAP